jgi:transcriptional regulator with XRE-family HTH domain
MNDKPKNHLRAWREFREMSQEELADRLDTAKGVISLLENGKRPLSDKWLRRLAEVLETNPGHILDVDPNELDNDIIDIWTRIPERDREQAARILRTFTKTGTDDQ